MSQEDYLALKDLRVTGDVVLEHIMDLTIERQINEHSKLKLIGMVTETSKEAIIQKTRYKSKMGVTDKVGKVLFEGSISQIEAMTNEGNCYVIIEALSASWWLDQQLKKRSFIKDQDTYQSVVKEVGKTYNGFNFVGKGKLENKITSYLLQYNETDFEFIKRVASRINAPVIVKDTENKPRFYIGLPEHSEAVDLKEATYKSVIHFGDFVKAEANGANIRDESECRGYVLESPKILTIGQAVTYHNRTLVVTKMKSILQKGLLVNEYEVMPSAKTELITDYNKELKGVSIKGTVTNVKGTKVKVKLVFDKDSVENWYTYGTSTANVMYCMPYVGDTVNVHFPSSNEEEALAITSVYKGSGLQPDIKFWSNAQGKKVEFTPSSLELQAKKDMLNNKELLVKMTHKEGIEIKSDHSIQIACDGLLSLKAKTINMIAPEAVHLCTQKESRKEPLGVERKGLCLYPTAINFEVKNDAIMEGRLKQTFPFEEEPRPKLMQKPRPTPTLTRVEKPKPEKKKSKVGNFLKGLGLAVVAVAAVAVAVGVCIAAGPVIGGLLAAGTASMLLGIGMGVGLAIGGACTVAGAAHVGSAAVDVMTGTDYEEVKDRVEQGLAFTGSGLGIMTLVMSYGMAAIPYAACMDTKLAPYIDCRIVPGQGFFARIAGKGLGVPYVDKTVSIKNSFMKAGYVHTSNNDKYFGLQFGGTAPNTGLIPYGGNLPVPLGSTSLVPYGSAALMPIGNTGALMPYNPNPFTSAPTTQRLVEGSNPNLLVQNNQVGEVGKGNTGIVSGGAKIEYTYNMIDNPGILAKIRGTPAANFYGGKYNMEILTEDRIFYRAGQQGKPLGQWFTSEPAESVTKVRIDLAVKEQWIDPIIGNLTGTSIIDTNYAIKIPKGTIVYMGPVGYQGGAYLGGEDIIQSFIQEPWKIKGVEVISEKPLY